MQIFFSTEFPNVRVYYLYVLHKTKLYKASKVHKKPLDQIGFATIHTKAHPLARVRFNYTVNLGFSFLNFFINSTRAQTPSRVIEL